jgi:prepilin-type N-terminal cleavage/methylation domain-containing protein
MTRTDARRDSGFTLIELLVVLLIIGILSTVALRTIDATRDRALFDQTSRELGELVQAISGNPDLTYDGRRTDFGFYGDMGKLPDELRDLVHNPSPGDTNWRGPYIRSTLGGDSLGYLYDGWGNPYSYNAGSGTIASLGNGKFPLSMRVADSLPQLSQNSISGSVTDAENNPPGNRAPTIAIWLRFGSDRPAAFTTPDAGGYYEFSPATGVPVPIGTHRVVVVFSGGDSIARWVTVVPRSRVILDMRYNRTFRNQLVMIGVPQLNSLDSSGFAIQVVNEGTTDDTVTSLLFAAAPDSAFMRTLEIVGQVGGSWIDTFSLGRGRGGEVTISPGYGVAANRGDPVTFRFWDFFKDSLGMLPRSNIHGQTFRVRFSDGSEITVTP